MSGWEPISNEEASSLVAQGVHTGLRKGSEAPSSGLLWRTIAESDDSAWHDAAKFFIYSLEYMGYRICKDVS